MNSYLKNLPSELVEPTFIQSDYDDILSLCQSEYLNICDDLFFCAYARL